MRYLLTGITGFLGPHLAKRLIEAGHEVYGLVRIRNGRENDIRDIVPIELFEQIKFVYGDLSNLRALSKVFQEVQFDGVYHLAGQTHPPTSFKDMPGTWEANVMGTVNLITAITDYQPKTKFLFCSTVEVYGNTGIDQHKLKETDPLLPANPYGASKAAIDLFLQERIENKQMNAVIVRPFCFTGPRRGASYSISSDALQIAKMMLGKQDKVLRIGNLDTTRAVTDVRDVARALQLIMENESTSGQILNVCGGDPLKMRVYTETLLELSGLEGVEMKIDPALWRPIDIQFQDGDSSKLRSMTGWEPTIPIRQTMQDLLDYWVAKLKASPSV
jgi:GDP-4-dehydro-6-deoxy-D-mannose reductase